VKIKSYQKSIQKKNKNSVFGMRVFQSLINPEGKSIFKGGLRDFFKLKKSFDFKNTSKVLENLRRYAVILPAM